MRKIIATDKAPAAIGPYSQANQYGNLLITSGQCPFDPATGAIVGTTIEEQAKCSLNNLKAIIEAAGSSMKNVIKTTCFIKDMNDFAKLNAVYAEYFVKGSYPSRSAIEVARLPKDVLVEIEAIAIVE